MKNFNHLLSRQILLSLLSLSLSILLRLAVFLFLILSLQEARRWRRRAGWRRSRTQRGIQPATSDKAKAHRGKRGPCVHRHIYSRLYRGPGVDSFLMLTCAIVSIAPRDRTASCKSRPWTRKREREKPRETEERSLIAITTTPIPIIDTDTALR